MKKITLDVVGLTQAKDQGTLDVVRDKRNLKSSEGY